MVGGMDLLLMLHGVTRWCGDCAARTIYLPVTDSVADSVADSGADAWCCTACDAAIVLPSVLSGPVAA